MPVKITKARMKLATGPAATIAARLRNGCPAKVNERSTAAVAPSAARHAGGIGVAVELDISAERKRADPPAGAARVDPGEQLGTEAERESVDFDAAPSPDQIVPEFMEENDQAQNQDEGNDVPSDPRYEVGTRMQQRHHRASELRQPDAAAGRRNMVTNRLQWLSPTSGQEAEPPYLERYGELPALPQRRGRPQFTGRRHRGERSRNEARDFAEAYSPSRNADTAISLAPLSAVGAPPPARSASIASPSAGKRSRSARSKVNRPSAARSGARTPEAIRSG